MDHFTTSEMSPQPGDLCPECQKLGLEKYLRYFKINIQMEQIIKCESDTCLYPHNDEVTSSASSSLSSSPLPSPLQSPSSSLLLLSSLDNIKTKTEIDANGQGNCCGSSSAWLESSLSIARDTTNHVATITAALTTTTTTASYKMESANTTEFNVKYNAAESEAKKRIVEILSVGNLNTNRGEQSVQNNSEMSNNVNVNSQEEYKVDHLNLKTHITNNEQRLKLGEQISLQNDVATTPLWNISKAGTNSEAYIQNTKTKMLLQSYTPLATMDTNFFDIPQANIGVSTSNTITERNKMLRLPGSYENKLNACNNHGKSRSIYSFQDDTNVMDIIESTTQQESSSISQLRNDLPEEIPKSRISSDILEAEPVHNALDQVMNLLTKRNSEKSIKNV